MIVREKIYESVRSKFKQEYGYKVLTWEEREFLLDRLIDVYTNDLVYKNNLKLMQLAYEKGII